MLHEIRRCDTPRRHLAVKTLTCLLGLLGMVGLPSQVLAADKQPAETAAVASARVAVEGAWIRPTVKGQTATGGYMTLTAAEDLTLVGFSTSVAGETELHEMVMGGNVMRMRAIDALALPAGQAVTMKPGPGAKHLMLMGLKRPLQDGSSISLKLKLRTADGKILTQEVQVPVRAASGIKPAGVASGAASGAHQGMHHHHHGH